MPSYWVRFVNEILRNRHLHRCCQRSIIVRSARTGERAIEAAKKTTLAEVMTSGPNAMPSGNTAIEALRLMEDGRYRHLPIVEDGKVVGIVSRFDFSGIEFDRLDEETGLWERI